MERRRIRKMAKAEAAVAGDNSEFKTNAKLDGDELKVVSYGGTKRPLAAIDARDAQAAEGSTKKPKQENDLDDP